MRKSVLIIFGIIIVTLILVNIFANEPKFNDPLKQIDHLLLSKQYSEAEEIYANLISSDDKNLDLHYGRIQAHYSIPEKTKVNKYDYEYRDDSPILGYYQKKAASKDSLEHDIGFYGMGLCWSVQDDYKGAKSSFDSVFNKNLKYLNNSIGRIFYEQNQLDSAETYYIKEIKTDGNINGSYSNLIELYLSRNQLDKLDSLLNNDKVAKYFSGSDLSELYFKQRQTSKYLINILLIGFKNLDFKSFISALLISLVWLEFFRRIDIYKPEKAQFIIVTFLLGTIFSYGTFIISDFTNHIFKFDLNGNVINDFLYCFVGIGLVEELMKLIPFLIIFIFTKEIDEPIDFIIYPAVSAIGFAFAENILYFHGKGLDIMHGRALISVVVHMICSSLIGYGVLLGFLKNRKIYFLRVLLFLIFASFVHGFFDFWLINPVVESFAFLSFFLVIFGLIMWNKYLNNAINFTIPPGENVKIINIDRLKDYLIYSLTGILIFEYVLITFSFGPNAANKSLFSAAFAGAYLIPFISNSLSQFRQKRNKFVSELPPFKEADPLLDAIVGKKMQFKNISNDRYNIFPLSGEIYKRDYINERDDWYFVKLDRKIENIGAFNQIVAINIKYQGEQLKKGNNTIVGFFLIVNDDFFNKELKELKDLKFVCWARAK
jgi:RsiW-degrading membrane proteinase PrsW (M82 family)